MYKIVKKHWKFIELSNGLRLKTNCYDTYNKVVFEEGYEVDLVEGKNLFWPIILIDKVSGEKIRARYWYGDELIPKGKFDFDTISKIEGASIKDIELVLPDLFEWTEDVNWPIAPQLAEILPRFGEIIIPYVIHYLRYPSGLDEYATYYYLMPKMTKEQLELIKEELILVVENPTEFQKREEYDKFAKEYINKLEAME